MNIKVGDRITTKRNDTLTVDGIVYLETKNDVHYYECDCKHDVDGSWMVGGTVCSCVLPEDITHVNGKLM
jgi:hypothetical protein